MTEIRNHDRYLDPPDEPTHWECDRCGCIFDGGDMTKIGDRWYCDECLVEVEIEERERSEMSYKVGDEVWVKAKIVSSDASGFVVVVSPNNQPVENPDRLQARITALEAELEEAGLQACNNETEITDLKNTIIEAAYQFNTNKQPTDEQPAFDESELSLTTMCGLGAEALLEVAGLRETLEEIRALARTGLPPADMTEEYWKQHKLNRISGMASFVLDPPPSPEGW